ncbi:hypothetical protein FAM09_00990 [Niastella caeni]|uniref:Uncharacterized protein n=1 Tax=Niastella caeni TaxID=2569763 RepID=A0A4S8HYH3_9BACT|nr:hypothetical protein [Niastella caeni]THU40720.1 hypothetical protein FAM09_00990 [Niastella caeni]
MCRRKLLLTLQPLLFIALLVYVPSFAQLRWDGEAGDGQWITAQNWAGDILPTITDDVILDNVYITGGYTVTLPGGNSSVHVKSITITPASGNNIELILPAANTAIPAFKVSGAVYGMVIGNGGIFKNASGANNGLPVEIADSLKINNGGRYIQNSSSSHAAIITVLSKAPGTEEGIFEFDIPSASSTVSLSGRTYGKLVFLSNAMNGAVTYTASGTNTVKVKSDLYVGAGVTLSFNFSDSLFIGRDLIQQGGTINLGNSTRTLVAVISRHLIQSATGIICERGTAFPEIVFNGSVNQQIDCKGTVKDSVAIKMNNTAGATLMSSWSLPYKLSLTKGKIITSAVNILKLLPGCSIIVDSLSDNSFIDGPLRKEGLSAATHFLFPVGKGSSMRWLALKNANGHFNVEFTNSNPKQISNTYGSGINQISQIGYWTIHADAGPLASASIELSFNGPNSGVGTNLATSKVASLDNQVWVNYGNTAFTGTAGSRGSVVSNQVTSWSTAPDSFTLGSSEPVEGPLALNDDPIPAIRNSVVENNRGPLQLLAVTFSGSRIITCRASEKTQVKLCIVDNSGRHVKVITTIIERGVNRLPVEVPTLPAGVYSMYAVTPKGTSNVVRFVYLK